MREIYTGELDWVPEGGKLKSFALLLTANVVGLILTCSWNKRVGGAEYNGCFISGSLVLL